MINLYRYDGFAGKYSANTCAIIRARDRNDAIRLLDAELTRLGFPQELESENLHTIGRSCDQTSELTVHIERWGN